jgi:hypothetical protein
MTAGPAWNGYLKNHRISNGRQTKAGNLKILQTRPLHAIKPHNDAPRLDLPVLAKGEWASPGLVSGKIYT